MLLRGLEPNIEARALVADFLDRHRFGHRKRGRPEPDCLPPWTKTETRSFAVALLTTTPPAKWKFELARRLVLHRAIKCNTRTPVYLRTLRDAQLLCAAAETRSLMRMRGIKLAQAAEHIAPLHYLAVSTLLNYMGGHRGSRRHARDK